LHEEWMEYGRWDSVWRAKRPNLEANM
jgi:hypothetical protein